MRKTGLTFLGIPVRLFVTLFKQSSLAISEALSEFSVSDAVHNQLYSGHRWEFPRIQRIEALDLRAEAFK